MGFRPMRLVIGESLALGPLDGAVRAFCIVNAKAGTLVIAEIEFGQIPLQVGGGHMEIRSGDTALEDREVIFDGVGMPETAAHVFFD